MHKEVNTAAHYLITRVLRIVSILSLIFVFMIFYSLFTVRSMHGSLYKYVNKDKSCDTLTSCENKWMTGNVNIYGKF